MPDEHVSVPEFPHVFEHERERLSSILASQSLSTPSQISVWGVGALHVDHTPAEQVSIPVPHAEVQVSVRFSSTRPSQSLSTLSQRSDVITQTGGGGGGGGHAVAEQEIHAPREHVSVPVFPHSLVHARERLSSVELSQSLSLLSQISV
jgi:hypothetical protein